MSDCLEMRSGLYRRVYAAAIMGRRINSVSIGAEFLFWRLNMIADDFGIFMTDIDLIKAEALKRRPEVPDSDIVDWLKQLVEKGLLVTYSANSENYAQIVDFAKYQPAPRNGRRISRHPGPEDHASNPTPTPTPTPRPKPIPIPNPTKVHVGESGGTQGNPGESKPTEEKKSIGIRTPQDSPGFPDFDDAIARIYEAYPRKVGKTAALKAIEKALKGLSDKHEDAADWLLRRVRLFAKSPAGKKGEFTPHPATWFNQGRFDDDAQEWERGEPGAEANAPPLPDYNDAQIDEIYGEQPKPAAAPPQETPKADIPPTAQPNPSPFGRFFNSNKFTRQPAAAAEYREPTPHIKEA